jgi:hypothetical protein
VRSAVEMEGVVKKQDVCTPFSTPFLRKWSSVTRSEQVRGIGLDWKCVASGSATRFSIFLSYYSAFRGP